MAEIIYYTCNTHPPEIDLNCRRVLKDVPLRIVCVSLNSMLDFGDHNIMMTGERGPLMMFRQILTGLRASDDDYVFLCESDVLYPFSHFSPPAILSNEFLYNTNVWKMRFSDGLLVWTDNMIQVSGLFSRREFLMDWVFKKIDQIKKDGFDRHYEPGVRQKLKFDCKVNTWESASPLVCVRHDKNLTKSKWSPEEFRNSKFAYGWKTAREIPLWGTSEQILSIFGRSGESK